MKHILFASMASVFATAFMFEACETVMIEGKGGDPVRVNKSDYDADQAPGGAKSMTLHADDKDPTPDPVVGDVFVPVHPALSIPPAPSAPHSLANPATPNTATADTLMVASNGKTGAKLKFFVVRADGTRVTDMKDVDVDGYDTDALAWAAVMAVKRQPFEQSIEPPAALTPAPVIEGVATS